MHNWQIIFVVLFAVYSLTAFIKGYNQTKIKRNPYGLSVWFNPLGSFVWSDRNAQRQVPYVNYFLSYPLILIIGIILSIFVNKLFLIICGVGILGEVLIDSCTVACRYKGLWVTQGWK